MGGHGSTRWDCHRRRCTVEESYKLSIRDLGASNLADPQWCDYGRAGVSLHLGSTTELPDRTGTSWLQRSITLGSPQSFDDLSQPVQLLGQPMRFGGVRWWFICPDCSRRRVTLYFPSAAGARRWSCRKCYGLKYRTQRLEPTSRFEIRMHRVARSLEPGCENSLNGPPWKPKWMRWTTYARRCATWYKASDARNRAWSRGALSFLNGMEKRFGKKRF